MLHASAIVDTQIPDPHPQIKQMSNIFRKQDIIPLALVQFHISLFELWGSSVFFTLRWYWMIKHRGIKFVFSLSDPSSRRLEWPFVVASHIRAIRNTLTPPPGYFHLQTLMCPVSANISTHKEKILGTVESRLTDLIASEEIFWC